MRDQLVAVLISTTVFVVHVRRITKAALLRIVQILKFVDFTSCIERRVNISDQRDLLTIGPSARRALAITSFARTGAPC